MRIIGVDPGLIATGYGVVDVSDNFRLECRAAGVIRPDSKDLSARMLQIHAQLTAILHEFIPDALAVEDLYATYEFPKTAILMGHARGVIYLAAAQRAVPVTSYASTALKSAIVGHGRASKEQVQLMVQRLLALPELPTPDHISDALALAICHAHRGRGLPALLKR
ncbi:MAG TPA: crossover junction endodeoxyribonuclease RuvC [Armatimonadota bacterium]|jgi:crossover junction endodeoxyribonuclease RuvC